MKKWFKLIIGILAIYGFVEFSPHIIEKIEMYRNIKDCSAERGIDNNTIFYSEEPISYEAEQLLQERLQKTKSKGALEN